MEPKSLLKQQRFSQKEHEEFLSYHSYRNSKHQTRFKQAEFNGSADNGQRCGQRGEPYEGTFMKSSGQWRKEHVKRRVRKGDDIVRYMSNLPEYLQRDDRAESLQGNALNFGVLDWTRLEKWKHEKKGAQAVCRNDLPSSGTSMPEKTHTKFDVFLQTTTSSHPAEHHHPSACSSGQPSRRGESPLGYPPSLHKFRHSRESDLASGDTYERKAKTSNFAPLRKDYSGEIPGRSTKTYSDREGALGTGSSSAKMTNSGVLLNERSQSVEIKMKDEEARAPVACKRVIHRRMISESGASSSGLRVGGVSVSLSGKPSAKKDKTKKEVQELSDPIDLPHHRQAGNRRDVNPVSPNKQVAGKTTHQEEPTKWLHYNLTEAKGNSDSNGSAHQNLRFVECRSGIAHSCPLSYNVDSNPTSVMPHDVELPYDASDPDKRERDISDSKFAGSSDTEERRASDAESTDTWDQELSVGSSKKGRHPSPNRRFSFSFSRIGRSFSFKEGSSGPQLSCASDSVKSGPVRPDDSGCLDGSNSCTKSHSHEKARASPFRRILDPILKSKVVRPIYSTDIVPPSHGKTKSVDSKPLTTLEPIWQANDETSIVRSLVQLTVRNGIPLFQFVIDNNGSSVLAATLKNSTTSEKDDLGLYCTFYSVNEVKKKSSKWMGHHSKEKHCGFVYNVIGQMKMQNSPTRDVIWCNSEYIVRESVLYEIDTRQAAQAFEKPRLGRELAAMEVRTSNEKSNHNSDKSLPEKFFKDNISTAVILPGAVHNLPNKGLPSPLIDRWRSGGSCDCGGWDIGCKLKVLSNKVQPSCHQCQLFYQEGNQNNVPVFNMVPLKRGIYTVEFSSSFSMLQAFFVAVTLLSCHRPLDLSDASPLSEPKASLDLPMGRPDQMKKNLPPNARETPVKYAPNPPLSPVGRV